MKETNKKGGCHGKDKSKKVAGETADIKSPIRRDKKSCSVK